MRKLGKLLLGGAALAVVAASPAVAADLAPAPVPAAPYYKAPVVEPLYDWTGFYIGAHANYTWSHNNFQTENTATGADFAPGSNDTSAAHFGGQIGYDYMLPSRWVLGVVADISSGRDQTTTFSFPTVTTQLDSDNIVNGTFRARAGYAFNNVLLYGTAGGTWDVGHNTQTVIAGTVGDAGPGTVETESISHIGWTAGAGLDYAFAHNWDVFAEYRYAGNQGVTVTYPIAQRSTTNDISTNTVELGVNYRFNYGR
jgi:opacity protein-like surface antigen